MERLPDPGSTIVKVDGEIDISNATALRDGLELASDADQHLIVDMEGVTFIDSSGVDALVTLLNQTGIHHRGLVLQNPSQNVRMVIGVLGLEDTFGLDVMHAEVTGLTSVDLQETF
jgi:anti-anti-sigma factor